MYFITIPGALEKPKPLWYRQIDVLTLLYCILIVSQLFYGNLNSVLDHFHTWKIYVTSLCIYIVDLHVHMSLQTQPLCLHDLSSACWTCELWFTYDNK